MGPSTASIGSGLLVGFSLLLFVFGRVQQRIEWRKMARAILYRREEAMAEREAREKATRRVSVLNVPARLTQAAVQIGDPDRAGSWLRTGWLLSAVFLVLAVVTRDWLFVALVPAVWMGVSIWSGSAVRNHRRKLTQQTRLAELLITFLVSSGATLQDALLLLEERFEAPLGPALHDVRAQARYTSLPDALTQLAKSTGVEQLSQFAALIAESVAYGTPVGEAILRSYELDSRLRDNQAAGRISSVQLELTMYSTLMVAMPGFTFVLVALLAYVFRLLTGFF